MITLSNAATAAAYEALTDTDQFVDIPARRPAKCYRGMISAITPEAAERYVTFGGNLIAKKNNAQIPSQEQIASQSSQDEEEY